MPYYAVQKGRNAGVYESWSECESNVKGYSGSSYKKFSTLAEAQSFSAGAQATSATPSGTGSSSSSSNRFYAAAEPSAQRNVAYTDGSCLNNGQAQARGGYGVYFPETSKGYSGPLAAGQPQTNQRAELEAVKKAIEVSRNDPRDLEIRTDSKYACKGLTDWSKNWEKDWDQAKVKNKDSFREIIDLASSSGKNIYMRHVPGHSGEAGNEQAHDLATQGSQSSHP